MERVKFLLISILTVICLSVPAYAGGTIDKNKIWHYYGVAGYGGSVAYQMRFGNDTILDGKKYTEFYTFSSTYYERNGEEIVAKPLGEGMKFYMREDNGKVYLYDPYDHWNWQLEESECMLYDFSLKEGDIYESIDAAVEVFRVKVAEVKKIIRPDGRHYTQQTLLYKYIYDNDDDWSHIDGEVTIIEGIGFVGDGAGTLAGPQITRMTGTPGFAPPYPYKMDRGKLVKVTDLSGNPVFEEGVFTGIPEIGDPSEKIENKDEIYNLQGIRVADPHPGQIYIRNGRKFKMRMN